MSERLTAPVHGPTSGQRSLHFRQDSSVRASASKASIAGGGASNEGPQESTNGTDSLASTVSSPTVLSSSPRSAAGVRSTTRSGPAIASSASSSRRLTQGTVAPELNRTDRKS